MNKLIGIAVILSLMTASASQCGGDVAKKAVKGTLSAVSQNKSLAAACALVGLGAGAVIGYYNQHPSATRLFRNKKNPSRADAVVDITAGAVIGGITGAYTGLAVGAAAKFFLKRL